MVEDHPGCDLEGACWLVDRDKDLSRIVVLSQVLDSR